ncbi:endonuclease [Streptomyces sp. ISL-98]|uniref:endonuclease n=1 Tax=Streptomyces sp. ISL-98 TaxID=2819192 RepID=UPI001BEAFB31|nr:endonuclease [Streptomyces sp. ISL-98]MBT2511438.1 endonuclease [Streptomyces sp. ISL-98]
MTTAEYISEAETDYLAQLEEAGKRFESRTAQREETRRTIDRRGVLYADEPDRVKKRLARLNADWSLARSIERIPTEPSTSTGSTLPLTPETFGADVLGLERLMGRNNLTGVAFLEGGYLAARSIGRVTVRAPAGGHHGTGFMVSPSLLMTNNHVLRSPEEAGRAVIEFNFQAGLDGVPLVPVTFALEPQRFFATDRDLDFSVVAVAGVSQQGAQLADFNWLFLDAAQGKVILGEFVNIIQHPNGEPKQLALRENQIVDLLDQFAHYATDTAPGSSGSPVFNDQWEVVALHHSAVPKTDSEGRPLAIDGTVWRPGMGEHRMAWKANEGVRISRVLQALSRLTLTGNAARLRDELFKPPATPRPSEGALQTTAAATARPAADGFAPKPLNGSTQLTSSAAVGLTVPLRITIGVDLPTPEQPTRAQSVAGLPSLGTVAAGQVDGSSAAAAAERDLHAALRNLQLGEGRVYYDGDANRAARDAYYASIDESVNGNALRRALTDLLEETHERRPSYAPSRMLYPWVDLHPDHLLRSVYSGKTFTAEELIRADAAAEAARLKGLQEFLLRESTAGSAELAAELDALEASLPFNCEHVVPQSWFAKREPMRGDLHHLFACEPECNSFRGNIPYIDFPGFDEVVREDCGMREKAGFEPEHSRGAVARATLYFLLRYPKTVGDTAQEFPEERLPVLLDWHENEPVTEYELHRNAAIAEIQGNRNPLIDHPEWARNIDFSGVWS